MPQHSRHNTGFTLTEIIVVIIIMGVLASAALPKFTGTVERVRAAEGVQLLTALLGAQKAYEFENGSYSAVLADLDIEVPRANNFVLPPTVANPVDPVANPIASIRRSNAYWLRINENGQITCVNAAPNNFTCAQAGY